MPIRLITIALLLLIAAPTAAGPIHDADRKYTVTIPANWITMSAEEVLTRNKITGLWIPFDTGKYVRGFRPKDAPPDGYPCVLIEIRPLRTELLDIDEVAELLRKEFGRPVRFQETKLTSLGRNTTPRDLALDSNRHRFVYQDSPPPAAPNGLCGVSVGHIGESKVVCVHAFAEGRDYDRLLPAFQELNDSFTYDPGAEFRPVPNFQLAGLNPQELLAAAVITFFSILAVVMAIRFVRLIPRRATTTKPL